MVSITPEQVARLQGNTKNIRNICIVAHVDHGKTTLSDFLISSNGVISENLAGKVRYMDSREDEQEKRITMKSSCISLMYQPPTPQSASTATTAAAVSTSSSSATPYLINLIDSPGHVDFSSEVSTAARLTDGALVLVDVLEGVSTQTRSVIMQAFRENIKPCLVLNKIDRLIIEKQMTPLEAYRQMSRILEQVNALLVSLAAAELFKTADDEKNQQQQQQQQQQAQSSDQQVGSSSYEIEGYDDIVDSDLFFSPEKGNVAFGSAHDGWAFRINHFAQLFSKKMGIKQDLLQKTLWGEHYLNKKTKKIVRKPSSADQEPMFVSFILNNIFEIYHQLYMYPYDNDKIEKILGKFGHSTESTKRLDKRMLVRKIMSQWLSLSDAVLGMVVEQLPSPIEAQRDRIMKLIPELRQVGNVASSVASSIHQSTSSKAVNRTERMKMREYRRKLKKNLLQCDKNGEVFAFVSKMLEVDTLPSALVHKQPVFPRRPAERRPRSEAVELPANGVFEFGEDNGSDTTSGSDAAESVLDVIKRRREALARLNESSGAEDGDTQQNADGDADSKQQQLFVGFARIFSGTIRPGQKLHILGPRYNALNPKEHRVEITVDRLYLLMGRSLEYVEEVPAGCIFGISGVSEHILKSATIASSTHAPIFSAMYQHAAPIVKIVVEPRTILDMPRLVEGLKLLNQSDPSVESFVSETGEHVIMTSGEVHAERCLRDLREKFAKCEIDVSPPLVSFKETIVPQPAEQDISGTVQSRPEPATIVTADRHATLTVRAVPLPEKITQFIEENKDRLKKCTDKELIDSEYGVADVFEELKQLFDEAGKVWSLRWDKLWALGPRRYGPNILVNDVAGFMEPFFQPIHKRVGAFETTAETDAAVTSANAMVKRLAKYESSIITGFQIATLSGPLCEEPMFGVCFIVENVEFHELDAEEEDIQSTSAASSDVVELDEYAAAAEAVMEDKDTLKSASNNMLNNQSKRVTLVGGPSPTSFGSRSGQIMSAMKDACRKAFDVNPRRLVEAMYRCEIQTTQDSLGAVYGVLRRRRAKVTNEVLEEGSGMFIISSWLPVAESFGFSDEMRKKASGHAQPQLLFSHWQVLEVDPFFFPQTEEELEEHGAFEDKAPNIARDYIDKVRIRKGLMVNKQLVESGEKQRTLKRNK